MGWGDDAFIPRKEERAGGGSVTRASTVGTKPSLWPAGKRAVGCKKCAAQNKAGGVQLTSSRSSGKWPGLASTTGGWGLGVGGTCDPLPALRLRQVRASLGAALRYFESARARGQIQPGMPQCFRLRRDRAQRAGLWPPRPRAAVTRAPGARAVGPRAKRARRRRSL